MTRSERNLADLQFIIDEINKQSSWSFDDYKQHRDKHPEDIFDNIPLKNGSHIPTNAAVGERFRTLASRNSASDQERLSYDRDSYIKELKSQFAHFFLKLGLPLDRQIGDKLVGKALSNLKKKRLETTHFIPCEITYPRHSQKFSIGDVNFYSMTTFSSQYMETIQKMFDQRKQEVKAAWKKNKKAGKKPLVPGATLEGALEAQQQIEADFENFYQNLGWVAEIRVPPCLPDISFSRAKETVNAALDVLKMFLGADIGKNFRIAYDKGHSPRTASLIRDDLGEFHTGWTLSGHGALAPENWIEDLNELYPVELQITGITVNHLLSPKPTTPLFEKWLGALLWYGQGVSDSNYAAKIVKYVAALEQLTIAKKSSDLDITRTVTARTKFLCTEIIESDDADKSKDTIGKMYRYRSDLMHGQISPSNPKIHEIAKRSGKILQQALFSALHLFVYLATENRDSLKELEKEYQARVS